MATTQYIGSRYVPILADPVEWSSTKSYEPLTIVTHEGNSYTSRQFVPVGIDIDNEAYWALTGNYNAQIELYRRETEHAVETVSEWLDAAQVQYMSKSFAFDTVEDMRRSDVLYVGAICHTNGFHTSGDGGAAWYVITNTGTVNGMDVLTLHDGLRATLIVTEQYVTPEMFGGLSIDSINLILTKNITTLKLSGSLTTNQPIVIDRPITFICDDFALTQTVWGYPAIIVQSDNVEIKGNISLVCDVSRRTPITNPYYPQDADPKASSTGIMLGHGGTFSNFHAEKISVKNFISGVCNASVGFTNVNIDYLYVENVDFGLFGAHYLSTHVKCVEFKNIASYIGSTDPSHAIYLTGSTAVGLSDGVTIDYVMGDGCNSKSTDTVISVKSTLGFACFGGHVKNIAALASVLNSSGFIENIVVDNSVYGISAQNANTDFEFRKLTFKSIRVSGNYINYFTTNSKVKITDCTFIVASDDVNYAYVYISGDNTEYQEESCIYAGPSASTCTLFRLATVNTKFIVIDPTANIALFVGNISMPNAYMLINPKKLNFPKTNGLIPNPHFIENDLIVDETEAPNYPTAFRTNDKVRVTNANVGNFNNNNATNGVVYTLYNGGNSQIIKGARIVTKSGTSYTSEQWSIFRFMNVGNVAYEI